MVDFPSPNPEPETGPYLFIVKLLTLVAACINTRDKLLVALKNLSLANLETTLSSLERCRSDLPPIPALPFLLRQGAAKSEVMNIYDRFALSAKPDYFVTADYLSKQDQNRIYNDEKHYDDVIQRLEYSHTDSNEKGGNDGLPQYIFQLGRLILPVFEPVFAYKLPFLAVVDVLDPRKAVWLAHVGDIAEDPEEGRDWYPPRYVLEQLACFFDGPNRREPVYHIAQVAPSLEEWMTLDWDTVMSNIKRTRRRGILNIKVAWEDDFKLAIHKARKMTAVRILSVAPREVGLDKQYSGCNDTTTELLSR